MPRFRALLLSATVLALAPAPVHALEGVVASIKPVHSLVAGVMKGAGEPHLLVRGAASPHTYSLRPSDARALESARLVFWVGPRMEVALDSAIDTLGANARVVELGDAHGLTRLPFREGGPFEAHEHEGDEHGHDAEASAHDDHDHDDEGHDHEETSVAGHDDQAHAGFDMHVWLDPENAAAMVDEIEEALSQADPDNAALYVENADALRVRLSELETEIVATLEPVKDRPFVVFHDAYQYFEKSFGLRVAGSITVSPDVMPGAERLREIQQRVRDLGATCVFAEPQFEPRLVTVATEGTGVGSGTLDPLGAELADGADLYFVLMRTMAASIRDCLTEAG